MRRSSRLAATPAAPPQAATKKRQRAPQTYELYVTFPRFGSLEGTVIAEEEDLFTVRWRVPDSAAAVSLDWKLPAGETYLLKHTASSRTLLATKFATPDPDPDSLSFLLPPPPGCRLLVPYVAPDNGGEACYYCGPGFDNGRWWCTRKRLLDPDMIGEHGYSPHDPSYPAALYILLHCEVESSLYGTEFTWVVPGYVSDAAFSINDELLRGVETHGDLGALEQGVTKVKHALDHWAAAPRSYTMDNLEGVAARWRGAYDALWALVLLLGAEHEASLQGCYRMSWVEHGDCKRKETIATSIALVAEKVLCDPNAAWTWGGVPGRDGGVGLLMHIRAVDSNFRDARVDAASWKSKKARDAWAKVMSDAERIVESGSAASTS